MSATVADNILNDILYIGKWDKDKILSLVPQCGDDEQSWYVSNSSEDTFEKWLPKFLK